MQELGELLQGYRFYLLILVITLLILLLSENLLLPEYNQKTIFYWLSDKSAENVDKIKQTIYYKILF